MSYLYDNLRKTITKKFMSVSVSHAPQKDPEFVDQIIETPEQVIKKDTLPIVENLVKPEYLKGDELTREFSFDRDIKVPYILHLCMYKLNRVLQQSFLEFYVKKENNEYVFSHKELSPELFEPFIEKEMEEEKIEPIVEEILGGGEPEDIDQAFLDQISIFFTDETGSPFVIENYKGFLEINNNIFIFIEIKQDILRDKENLFPIIIDEIINKRTINLSSNVLDLFTNNKILVVLKNRQVAQNDDPYGEITRIGNDIQQPRVLYLCKKEGGIYKNIYYEQQEVPHYTIINEQVLHPTLKNIYLFSEIPLPSETPIEFIKRYVAFTGGFVEPQAAQNLDSLSRIPERNPTTNDNLIRPPEDFGEPDNNNYWYTRSLLSFIEI